MSKQRVTAIEYIRGISMLGVVGIHTGAYSLTNPEVNVHLFALMEIFTRFSVPIFFFVSAFGLFVHHNLEERFDYTGFMQRRLRTVLVPYIVWSLLYMLHYTLVSGDTQPWTPPLIYEYLLFGLASYQLYFLVLLLWFYTLMPLWRLIVRLMLKRPAPSLLLTLILQIGFNYYSSYYLDANFANPYLNIAVQHRLSYWIVHYIFIFLFGAVCAVKHEQVVELLKQRAREINLFFMVSLFGMFAYYYYLLYAVGYTPEEAVNTDHQLSPIGVLYTLAATLFWFSLFSRNTLPPVLAAILSFLGAYSYHVYLIHPLVMYYLIDIVTGHGLTMTPLVIVAFYLVAVALSLIIGMIIQSTGRYIPLLPLLLVGSQQKRKNIIRTR